MIDIFIKSYDKDFKYLKYLLMSILKNVTGYGNVILLIPDKDLLLFEKTIVVPKNISLNLHYVKEYGNGYLYQQLCKLQAYKYTDLEFILFSDSDCIFDHPINVQDYILDKKPEILYTDYDKVGDAICWKQPTESIIKVTVPFEFMRRNCLIYHRSTLVNLNQQIPALENLVMNSERFSEFNLLGAYSFYFEKEKYNFINTDDWEYVPPKGQQLWSWAEKNSTNPTHVYEFKRALDIINETLNLNLIDIE